jgi:type II secretory pathway component GspD/PulD (secretin)
VHTACFCANTNGIPDGDPFAADTNHVHDTSIETPLITFCALDITLKEALDIVVEMARCKYRIRDGVVVIMPWNDPDGPIELRIYNILPTSIEADIIYTTVMGRGWIKVVFLGNGCRLANRGARLSMFQALGKLTVRNTEENLAIFENILSLLNVQPYQLELELVFLACERRQISALGPDGVSAAALMALWTNGAAELLASPKVLTQSGQEAIIRGGTECIYPTAFEVSSVVTTNNTTNSTASTFMVEPQDFATRELGASFKATASVSPDGNMIDVTLQPEFVETPVWEQFGEAFMNANGETHQTTVVLCNNASNYRFV